MKSDSHKNLSPQAIEVGQRYSRLPPEAQREISALMGALSRDADPGAIDVILQQRRSDKITGAEAVENLEALPGKTDA